MLLHSEVARQTPGKEKAEEGSGGIQVNCKETDERRLEEAAESRRDLEVFARDRVMVRVMVDQTCLTYGEEEEEFTQAQQ